MQYGAGLSTHTQHTLAQIHKAHISTNKEYLCTSDQLWSIKGHNNTVQG